jgi:hypothetical protein
MVNGDGKICRRNFNESLTWNEDLPHKICGASILPVNGELMAGAPPKIF